MLGLVVALVAAALAAQEPTGIDDSDGAANARAVWETPQLQMALPMPSAQLPIEVGAGAIQRWREGAYEVWHLSGGACLAQGPLSISSDEAIVWKESLDEVNGWTARDHANSGACRLIIYTEGHVTIDRVRDGPAAQGAEAVDRMTDEVWLGRLRTDTGLQGAWSIADIDQAAAPPIYHRALERRRAEAGLVAAAQFADGASLPPPVLVSPQTGAIQPLPPPAGMTDSSATGPYAVPQQLFQVPVVEGPPRRVRVQITPRSSVEANIRSLPGESPYEQVLVATGGLRVTIETEALTELAGGAGPGAPVRTATILADNVVAWSNALNPTQAPTGDVRWELYLEGNVVFMLGERVVYADRMYYNANTMRGTILNADMLTPIPDYRGLVRLKASVVQQLDENNFQAIGAAVTSSRLGVPRYWLQAGDVNISREQQWETTMFGQPLLDPATGAPLVEDHYLATSRGNKVYVGGVPVFYWPVFETDLSNPSFYLERVHIGNDRVFGTQLGVGLDLYQVLGIGNPPRDSQWIGLVDYLSDRGVGVGTEFDYTFDSFFNVPGPASGEFAAWFINDHGLDNLGRDRLKVPLEAEFRGRALWRHQQALSPDTRLRAEIGYLTDRNFLEQYYEREWDTAKDYTTGVMLANQQANRSLNLVADVRVNDFFTETEWLPRLDHFVLGQSVGGSPLVWHAHSHIGYGRFRPLEPPTNPVDLAKFTFLPWETAGAEGLRGGSRQELDLPFQAGPVRVVPYVLGDATYWQEVLSGDDITRLMGQTGLRASLPMWRVDPSVHSTLFNVNGLAHKMTFDGELLYADADQDLTEFPLFDPLDDNSQEAFRRRLTFDTFGGAVPLEFDERFFALRSALQSNVTAYSSEIADDLMLVKFGMRNRWQTKRGLPGEARIIDWITLDVEGSYFPRADRDNFGEDFGLVNYNFEWHIGDRLSLVSDGFFDFFSQGLRTGSIGTRMGRPEVLDLYLGIRSIEGPISSNILTATTNYRMSDKWIARASSSFDFGETGNIGQTLSLVRVGESFLIQFGARYDVSRENFGVIFSLEPRFLPDQRLGIVGGRPVPPAGAFYLE